MKEFIIYEKEETRVYICEGIIPKGKKLKTYNIRRDDSRGLAHYLGTISFNGRWRQYTTKFENDTEWSSGCKKKISEFEDKINMKWRKTRNKCQ